MTFKWISNQRKPAEGRVAITTCVYALRYPWNGLIFWYGITRNPKRRNDEHASQHGFKPLMCIVGWFSTEDNARTVEAELIEEGRMRGFPLQNKRPDRRVV